MSNWETPEIITGEPCSDVAILAANGGSLIVRAEGRLSLAPPHPCEYPKAMPERWPAEPNAEALGDDTDLAVDAALRYVRALFPRVKPELLSSIGTTAILLRDGRGNALKVARDSRDYKGIEHEAAALQLLSSLGFAPNIHALVDARLEFRHRGELPRQAWFSDMTIPRIQGGGALAVIIFDEIMQPIPLRELGIDELLEEFGRLATAIDGLGIGFPVDAELVFDQSRKIVVLDVRELSQYSERTTIAQADRQAYEGLSREDAARLYSITSLASLITIKRLRRWCSALEIRRAMESGGIQGVQDYLGAKIREQMRTDISSFVGKLATE